MSVVTIILLVIISSFNKYFIVTIFLSSSPIHKKRITPGARIKLILIFNELAKFQRGDIPSCLSTETPCIVNCVQFPVSVEKLTFPFTVEVIGITILKLVSMEINFQDITNDITDILFQSVHCSFPIGQFQNKFYPTRKSASQLGLPTTIPTKK